MDEEKKKKIELQVKQKFQLGRARLFRVEEERRVRAEIAKDKEHLFAHFEQHGLILERELTKCLARLLMNFSKIASYGGVLAGYRVFKLGLELGQDRARFYLFEYLQKHPDARNEELVRFLDRKNGRLAALKTRKNDPLWAPLPPTWRKAFERSKIEYLEGEFWETALREFPELVRPYLARTKKSAKEARVKNALYNWPEIIKQHKKRRKKAR